MKKKKPTIVEIKGEKKAGTAVVVNVPSLGSNVTSKIEKKKGRLVVWTRDGEIQIK